MTSKTPIEWTPVNCDLKAEFFPLEGDQTLEMMEMKYQR